MKEPSSHEKGFVMFGSWAEFSTLSGCCKHVRHLLYLVVEQSNLKLKEFDPTT